MQINCYGGQNVRRGHHLLQARLGLGMSFSKLKRRNPGSCLVYKLTGRFLCIQRQRPMLRFYSINAE